jgi:hypothetical protein
LGPFCFQVLVFGFNRVGQKMFETKYGSTAWVKRRFDILAPRFASQTKK